MTAKASIRQEPYNLKAFLKQYRQGNTVLFTLGELRKLPDHTQEEDPTVYVHFFGGAWDWWATEAELSTNEDGSVSDIVFFGKVKGLETELGYFTLTEIAEATYPVRLRGPVSSFSFNAKVERDQHWRPRPLSECM